MGDRQTLPVQTTRIAGAFTFQRCQIAGCCGGNFGRAYDPGVPDADQEPAARVIPEPVPAASVILLRDGADGLEVLLLRRAAKASFAADAWVFPGGGVEPEDGEDLFSLETARLAAARETMEEAAIAVDPQALIPYSQWCPPPESPKRFLTWFFVAGVSAAHEVTVDGGEITEHVWVRPADGLAARDEGRVSLLPPTWMTLHDLSERGSVAEVLESAAKRTPPFCETHIAFLPREDDPERKDVVALWEGDAGYEVRDASVPGARHRLRMGDAPWRYERVLEG
jgi:8-oxo-dGTP pyrophosphatase MutT (NUDIX family)